jgi:transposase
MIGIMATRDARSLDHKTLEEMRRLAVKAILAGEEMTSIAERLQVHYQTVSKWKRCYETEGAEGLTSTTATGRPTTLTGTQITILRRTIIGKNPQQLNFGPALWTLRLVGHLVERRFGVVLHKSTIGRLLQRIGVTPQKPIRRAFQRDNGECLQWMTEDFPAIVAEMKRKQAVLLFIDESGIHEDHAVGTTWGERGRTPVVRVSGRRRRINVISAISPQGRLWFRCYPGTLTAPLYVEFLKAILHDIRGPLVVIHDRHSAHVAAATRRFLDQNRTRLSVHELPAYAPDLNPDEHVWGYVKGTFRRDPLEADEELKPAVDKLMNGVKEDRALVRSFFGNPSVAYIRKALHWE